MQIITGFLVTVFSYIGLMVKGIAFNYMICAYDMVLYGYGICKKESYKRLISTITGTGFFIYY